MVWILRLERDAPACHEDDAGTHVDGFADAVGHQDQRDALRVDELLDLILKPFPGLLVERCQRLIQEEQARFAHEAARERDPLALAAAELPRILGAVAREPETFKHLFRMRQFMPGKAEQHIVDHALPREQAVLLEHDRAAAVPPHVEAPLSAETRFASRTRDSSCRIPAPTS